MRVRGAPRLARRHADVACYLCRLKTSPRFFIFFFIAGHFAFCCHVFLLISRCRAYMRVLRNDARAYAAMPRTCACEGEAHDAP